VALAVNRTTAAALFAGVCGEVAGAADDSKPTPSLWNRGLTSFELAGALFVSFENFITYEI